jgi:hypothetical protein
MFRDTLTPLTFIGFMLIAGPLSASDLLSTVCLFRGTRRRQPLRRQTAQNFDSGREPGSGPGAER